MNVFAKGESIHIPNIVKFQTMKVLTLFFSKPIAKNVLFLFQNCPILFIVESSPFHHSIYLSIEEV